MTPERNFQELLESAMQHAALRHLNGDVALAESIAALSTKEHETKGMRYWWLRLKGKQRG